jgi:hypothetical protein
MTGMIVSSGGQTSMMDFVNKIGADIAKSQMFGAESESQGRVIALACFVRGRDPLSIPMEYHLMKGKLSLRSDAMLGRFVAAGGKYEIVEHSPTAAEIRMEIDGRKFHERFTWEEAQQEPFVYEGKKDPIMAAIKNGKTSTLTLKDGYATPRRRMQQLWARVVSDGVRVVAPHLVTGCYSPEETADYSGVGGMVSESTDPIVTPSQVVTSPAATLAAPSHQAVQAVTSEAQTVADSVLMATDEQLTRMAQLFNELQMADTVRLASIMKRGAKSVDELTADMADDLIKGLEARLAQVAAAKVATTEPTKADAAELPTEVGLDRLNTNGPITQELLDKVVAQMRLLAQSDVSKVNKCRDRLLAAGMKLSDLTYDQGRQLLMTLEVAENQQFFTTELMKNVTVDESTSQDKPDV